MNAIQTEVNNLLTTYNTVGEYAKDVALNRLQVLADEGHRCAQLAISKIQAQMESEVMDEKLQSMTDYPADLFIAAVQNEGNGFILCNRSRFALATFTLNNDGKVTTLDVDETEIVITTDFGDSVSLTFDRFSVDELVKIVRFACFT